MAEPGVSACDKTVGRLIQRVSNRLFREGIIEPGQEDLSATFKVTLSSVPEYLKLERFGDREDYHARIQTYINQNALSVTWDRGAGEMGQLERITLNSPTAAAHILDIKLPWNIAASAIESLKAYAKESLHPIDEIIAGWKHGKSPGGISAEKSQQFIDALRVIEASRKLRSHDKDILLRRLSVQLFNDSKRIEGLVRAISYLLDFDHTDSDSVFAFLGLVKHPQPMLISGPQSCAVSLNDGSISLVKPYLGLRPDAIQKITSEQNSIERILTIENLASFNEAAEDETNPSNLLLIYVAGNPTPSLLDAYARILESLSPKAVLHWGDIDLGGFRIASRLAEKAKSVGFNLGLYQMNPAESATNNNEPAESTKIKRILEICQKHGWEKERSGLINQPIFQEQEFIRWKR